MLLKEEWARRAWIVDDVLHKHGIPTLRFQVSELVEDILPNPPGEVQEDILTYDWISRLDSLAPAFPQTEEGQQRYEKVNGDIDKYTHMMNSFITGQGKELLLTYVIGTADEDNSSALAQIDLDVLFDEIAKPS